MRVTRQAVLPLGGTLAFVAAWWGASLLMEPGTRRLFLPAPPDVIGQAVHIFRTEPMAAHLGVTLEEVAVAFLAAVFLGIPAGLVMGWYRDVDASVNGLITCFNAMPRIVFMPLMMIWFGLGIPSKIAVGFLTAVPVIVLTTLSGVVGVDKALVTVSRSFGASNRQVFWTVVLPSSVPPIMAGLRLGMGLAIVGVIVGELFAARSGLGYLINIYGNTFQTASMLVVIILVALIATAILVPLQRIEARFQQWRPPLV